jgi:hypothetical protein
MPTIPEVQKAALALLRRQENPFDALAQPQTADARFADADVPEILRQERKLLLAMIDSYRGAGYAGTADLPPTRVVTVRGPRGSGKTHMLQALLHRPEPDQVFVRLQYHPFDLPFEEYLLGQLRTALLGPDEVRQTRPFDRVAEGLTRQLLLQAVRSLDPVDRLHAAAAAGHRTARPVEQLAELLAAPADGKGVRALLAGQGFRPEHGARLIGGHLQKYERGVLPEVVVRRQFYNVTARRALLGEDEPLAEFLMGGYATAPAGATTRASLVSQLLACLVEACAVEGLPVVYLIDNLEHLLRPRNQRDPELAGAFLDGLAQAVDTTRGLLLFLFAESGLFDAEISPLVQGFALARLMQGVNAGGKTLPFLIDLEPPSYEEVRLIAESRIDKLLAPFDRKGELPDLFPLRPAFVNELATELQPGHRQVLRNILIRLREEYAKAVWVEGSGAGDDPAAAWRKTRQRVKQRVGDALHPHRQEIHAGLGMMLQQALPLEIGGWSLDRVEPTVSVGDNAAVGLVTLLEWRRASESSPEEAAETLRMAVGTLLSPGGGMPGDLAAKLEVFQKRSQKIDQLVILWPGAPEVNPADSLPRVTRQVWDASKHTAKSALRKSDKDDLRTMLAFPEWLRQVRDDAAEPLPAADVAAFVREQCPGVIQLVAPLAPAVKELVP